MSKKALLILFLIPFWAIQGHSQQRDVTTVERLKEHVYTLASDSLQGRRYASEGGRKAAHYIVTRFKEIGIDPFLETGYLQEFTLHGQKCYNVIGIIKGIDPRLSDEYIIMGAHYDHLGSKRNLRGDTVVYNGADDNASGTAVLIELARNLKQSQKKPKRSVIFVAFDAEEAGLHGSRHMAGTIPGSQAKLMVSMDMVGWLHEGKALRIAGIAMIHNGREVFSTIDPGEGLNVKLQRFDTMIMGGSDHDSFAEEGIPSLYISTGTKSPYHKPEDTAEKIDYEGMAQITDYMTAFTEEFASRETLKASGRRSFKHVGHKTLEWGITASGGASRHRYKEGALNGKADNAWNAGAYAQINIGSYFALRPKIVYEWRTAQWPGSENPDRVYGFSTNGLNVPVDFMVKSSSRSSIYYYIFAGGYYRHIFGGQFADSGYTLSDGIRNNEWGWQWGIGMRLYRLSLEYTGCYGLTPVLSAEGAPNLRARASYFTVSYRF